MFQPTASTPKPKPIRSCWPMCARAEKCCADAAKSLQTLKPAIAGLIQPWALEKPSWRRVPKCQLFDNFTGCCGGRCILALSVSRLRIVRPALCFGSQLLFFFVFSEFALAFSYP